MKPKLDTPGALAFERSRLMDYLTLTKPELTFLSVLTTLAGFFLGAGFSLQPAVLFHTLLGTALVGGGAGALNELIERKYDALMKRTENRPLPAGRLAPVEAGTFGALIALAGIAELMLFVNPLTAFLAAVTLASYLSLYTPLKRITPLATLIGAFPGAIPPLIGWTAAGRAVDVWGLFLFGILFFWQMPHFLSLGWMYRRDYGRAGYRLLAVLDGSGKRSARQVLAYTAALLATTLLPWSAGMFGPVYLAGAFALGAAFLAAGWRFYRTRSNGDARRVFAASLAYLPALMLVMIIDRLVF